MNSQLPLPRADRFLPSDPARRSVARELYAAIAELPIISPHGHVDPRLLADENATFGTPAELFVIPDHYVFRMLHSQGIALESLGIRPRDAGAGESRAGAGEGAAGPAVETDQRRIWQALADNLHLFRGTPSGIWLAHALHDVFGVREPLGSANAQAIYDELSEKSPHWKRIYPDWRKFRDEQFLWFRVAENTFDNFNFSMSAQGR